MDIEKLINKYIDGELSPKEDALLRSKLAEDIDLKIRFDAAVETQYLISKDADSIEVPEELYNASEEVVLARIMGRTAAIDEEKRRRKVVPFYYRWAGYSAAAGIALFALLVGFGIIDFGDLSLVDESIVSRSVPYQDYEDNPDLNPQVFAARIESDILIPGVLTSDLQESRSVPSGSRSSMVSLGSSTNSSRTNINIESSEVDELNIQAFVDNLDERASIEDNSENSSSIESSFGSSENWLPPSNSDNNGFSSQFGQLPYLPELSQTSLVSPELAYSNNTKTLQISSNMSSDMATYGTNDNEETISSFSISVGYVLNNDQILGVEFGRYNVLIADTEIRTVLSNPNDPTSTPLTFETPVSYDMAQGWATLFYEYKLTLVNDLTLSPRIGLGYGQAGPMGFARALLRYDLINGIGIRVGAEYRGLGYTSAGYRAPVTFFGSSAFIYGIDFSL